MIKVLSNNYLMNINFCCQVLKVSRSGYYAWLRRPESERAKNKKILLFKIKAIHGLSRKTYGSPRVHAKLAGEGVSCSKNTVAKIMSENNLSALVKKRFKVVTTDSNHNLPVADRHYQTSENR